MRDHFRKAASSFDGLYDDEGRFQRFLRPGLFTRRDAAVEVVRSLGAPAVLDVGCGSGRVAELMLDAGAASLVGVDFSEPMLELAKARLDRFGDRVRLVAGDFLTAELGGPFDVITALGLFDYTPEPWRFTTRMRRLCRGVLVASFPRWNLTRGPVRHLRYEVLNRCPIFDYTRRELEFLFHASGFETVEVIDGRNGFLVRCGP